MTGTYLTLAFLCACLIVWPEETQAALTSVSLKIQIWFLNLRLKWMAWNMYKSIVKQCKENGFPEPGPFKFVDIWDRKPLD